MEDDQKYLRKLNRRTRFTQFLVWIALFFTAVGIAAGYKNWLRIHEKAKAGLVGVAEIKKELPNLAKKEEVESLLARVDSQLKENTKHLDSALKELHQVQDSTQYIADTVNNQVKALTQQQEVLSPPRSGISKSWSLSEVRFLLQMANQVLTLKNDKNGAMGALTLADQLLLQQGSTELLPLRKQISKDIARLSQYKVPDIDAISEEINELQNELEPPQKVFSDSGLGGAGSLNNQEKDLKDNKDLPESESLVSRVKKTLNEAVIVRKFDKPIYDEMSQETQKSLSQLLSLRLETLRLMLLQGRDKSYHDQIGRLMATLKKYYAKEKFEVLNKRLEALNTVNLNPEVPDISRSLTLLDSMTPKLSKGE